MLIAAGGGLVVSVIIGAASGAFTMMGDALSCLWEGESQETTTGKSGRSAGGTNTRPHYQALKKVQGRPCAVAKAQAPTTCFVILPRWYQKRPMSHPRLSGETTLTASCLHARTPLPSLGAGARAGRLLLLKRGKQAGQRT